MLYLPDILKDRALDSPLETVSEFKRGMMALAIGTHNLRPQVTTRNTRVSEPEPYVRRNEYLYDDDEFEYEKDEIIPYPRNRARAEMIARRKRITLILLVITLGTGILTLIPGLRWVIPIHVVFLIILALYIFAAILLPGYERYR